MYSDVFRMYPSARVGKPSDTIKIQHARCEYKRILAHEGSMTLKYPTRYKQDTSRIQSNTDVSQTSLQDTVKIQAKYSPIQMYPKCIRLANHQRRAGVREGCAHQGPRHSHWHMPVSACGVRARRWLRGAPVLWQCGGIALGDVDF